MTLALHPARHPDNALAAARWPVQAAVLAAWPWLLSLAIGVAGALALFPVPVLLGTAPFWTLPRGIVGGSWADMEIALSGYDAFVRGAWGWPVFHIAGLGGTAGTQAILTDRTRLPMQACSRPGRMQHRSSMPY